MWVVFANAKFFSKNISVYAIFNDQSFNNMLTKYIISFEQLSSDFFFFFFSYFPKKTGFNILS